MQVDISLQVTKEPLSACACRRDHSSLYASTIPSHLNEMKISIPTLPNPTGSSPGYINPLAHISQSSAIAHVKSFLDKGKGKTLVLTGAGVSVDSGIRAYRGSEGHCESFGNWRKAKS